MYELVALAIGHPRCRPAVPSQQTLHAAADGPVQARPWGRSGCRPRSPASGRRAAAHVKRGRNHLWAPDPGRGGAGRR